MVPLVFPLEQVTHFTEAAAASDGRLTMLHHSQSPKHTVFFPEGPPPPPAALTPLTLPVSGDGLGMEEMAGLPEVTVGRRMCPADPILKAIVPAQRKEGREDSRLFLMPSTAIGISDT